MDYSDTPWVMGWSKKSWTMAVLTALGAFGGFPPNPLRDLSGPMTVGNGQFPFNINPITFGTHTLAMTVLIYQGNGSSSYQNSAMLAFGITLLVYYLEDSMRARRLGVAGVPGTMAEY